MTVSDIQIKNGDTFKSIFPLTVTQGGTGLTKNPSMLTNLASTTADSVLKNDPRPGVTGVLGLSHGGTGATSAANALKNFGLTATASELNNLDGVFAKLWEGTFVSGQITVPNLSKYNIFIIACSSDKTELSFGVRSPGTNNIRFYSASANSANGGVIGEIKANASGNTLKITKSNGWSEALGFGNNTMGIFAIWGVI